ncbi:hypothetical protein Tco_0448210 [Tanacetum coccineum]
MDDDSVKPTYRFYFLHENLEVDFKFGGSISLDKPTKMIRRKSKVIEESNSTLPDPNHQTLQTITTSLHEIISIHRPSLRSGKDWRQEMSEVKKTDQSADVLASIKSQVPTVVDKHLGTKPDDALLKSPKEIIRIKREQGEHDGKDAIDKELQSRLKETREKHDCDDEEMMMMIEKKVEAFSWIKSKKRSSDSSKKLKGIQTLTPAEQEALNIMKALKESKKMSKRQPGTGGSMSYDLHLPNPESPPVKNHFITTFPPRQHRTKQSSLVLEIGLECHGSPVQNQFRTCAFVDDSWIHQFRIVQILFSTQYVPPSQERTMRIPVVTMFFE